MAAIGVGVSTQDTVHGWESLKPTHPSVPEEIIKAEYAAHEAWKVFDCYIEDMIRGVDIDWNVFNEAKDDMARKQKHLTELRHELNSRAVVVGKQV